MMYRFSFTSMRRFIAAGLLFAGLAAHAGGSPTECRFTLDGSQVVPATASKGQAWAWATLDAGQTQFSLNLTHNLANAYGGAIRNAAAGARGPALLTLSSVATPVQQTWTVNAAFVTALNAGNLYLELYSNNYPGGEVRAQIVSATASFPLEGVQETPPTGSTATGHCVATLNVAQTSLVLNCTHNVSGANAAHIHLGAIGAAGGVVQTLTLTPTTASTTWALALGDVNNFLAGGLYVNIHNPTNPGGDIRGQMMAKWIRFPLTGSQETPPNASAATGAGFAFLSPYQTLLSINSVTHTVSGANAAHIHEGAVGVAGGVVFPFSSATSPISDSWALAKLDAVKFLAGLHYVNVHSGSFPGGEIRGQMADRDDDGIWDGADKCPTVFDPAQTDSDFDGAGDACDCAIFDNTQQSAPTAVYNLTAAKNAGAINLAWVAPAIPGGSPLRYDVIRSATPGDFSAATCVASNLSGTLTTDAAPPAASNYLIRAKNDCGSNLGYDSNGVAHVSPACGSCPAITVNPSTLAAGTVSVAYTTVNFTQVGGTAPITWNLVSGTLPLGMSFSAAGALSGTPTRPGSFPLVFKVTDVNGCSGTRAITLVVNCPVLSLAPAGPALADAFYNTSYGNTFVGSGGTAPYAYAVTSGSLPANLSLNGANGALSGTPNVTGANSFTITATDATTCTVAKAYTLAVKPDAVLESYPQTVIGNVSVDSALIPFRLTTNDSFPVGTTISAFDAASANGGTITMTTSGGSMGEFTYNPPAGFEGSDTFTYTLSSNGQTDTATVTVPVAGMIWFINNNAASCVVAGCGRRSNPFSTLAAFQALNNGTGNNPAINDNIFLYESATDYVGPATLLNGQKLIGQDATATLGAITGLTPGTGSAAFPAMNSGNGTFTQLTSGATVTLGSGNTVNGLRIGNGTTGITGASVGALNLTDLLINTTGAALSLSGGTVSGNGFSSVTSGGGTNCIALTNIAGTLNLGSGALSGATGATFLASGQNGSVTYAGTLTQNTANQRVVDIQNKTGGTITFNGAISSTGAGVFLNANNGATFNFTAGLNLSTGATPAFTATGPGPLATSGGTVIATQNNTSIINTLTTTTGAALNVANTTIGASGLTFRSIASGAGANNGITLDNTGASGGLTVTGNGGSCTVATPTCTGGIISGKTGADGSSASGIGIYLNNTTGVSLTRMDIEGNQNHGIRGNNVTGFTLDNAMVGATSVNGTSNTADTDPTGYPGESSVRFYNLLGSATISNSTLDLGFGKTMIVSNDTGTLNRLTITSCTLRNNQPGNATGPDTIGVQSSGSATLNLTVNGASVFNATRAFHITTSATQASTMDVQITGGNAFSNIINPVPAGGGMQFGSSGTDSFVTVNINGNSFRHGTGANPPGVNNVGRLITMGTVSGTSKFDGKIIGNTFGVTGIARSGSGDGADAIGIFASGNQGTTRINGTTHSRFLVQNNIIKRYGETGIQVNARQGNSIMDATVFGNTINEPGSAAQGAFGAIWVNAGALPSDTSRVDIVIGSQGTAANKNTMQDSDPNNADDVFLDKNSCGGCASVLNLYRNGSTAAAGQSEAIDRQILIDDNNPTLDEVNGFTNGSGATIGTPVGAPPTPP